MDLTSDILNPELAEAGYKVIEYPQDNIIELQLHGQLVKKWCATEETVKPKIINGTALQDNYVRNQYIENYRVALECGGSWSNG